MTKWTDRIFVAAFLVASFLVSRDSAADQAWIEGVVIYESGGPAAGARVRVEGSDEEEPVITDSEGRFLLHVDEPGHYYVTATCRRCSISSFPVDATLGERAYLEIMVMLQPSAEHEFGLIVVNGFKEIRLLTYGNAPEEWRVPPDQTNVLSCGKGSVLFEVSEKSTYLPQQSIEVLFPLGHWCDPPKFVYRSGSGIPYLVRLVEVGGHFWYQSATRLYELRDGSLVVHEPWFVYAYSLEEYLETIELPSFFGYDKGILVRQLQELHEGGVIDWYDQRTQEELEMVLERLELPRSPYHGW